MRTDLTAGANGACTQVDVEAVMMHIRDRAERRRQGTGAHESLLVADGLASAAWSDEQLEFNRRVTRALESITRYLQSISTGSVGPVEQQYRVPDSGVVVRGTGSKQAVERELGALPVETASALAQLAEQLQAGVGAVGEHLGAAAAYQARAVEGLNGRLDELSATVAASGRQADSALAQTSRLQQMIHNEFASLSTNLEARLTRLEQDMQADLSRQNDVAQSVDARLDAVLSRLESVAEATAGAAHTKDLAEELGAQFAAQRAHADQRLEQFEARIAALQEQVSAVSTDVEGVAARTVVPLADSVHADFERLQTRVADAVAQRETATQEVAGRVDHVIDQLDAIFPRLDAVTAETARLAHDLEDGLAQLTIRLLRVERAAKVGRPPPASATSRVNAAAAPFGPSDAPNPSPWMATSTAGQSGEPSHGDGSVEDPFDYVIFEHTFRGSRSEIRRRQEYYLDLFRDRGRVVDLGCGRGEFVELLAEQGIEVLGVDSNEDMFLLCQDRGLPVVQADLLQYLANLPDCSLGGVFACQIVEHLTPDQMLHLLQLCGEKLQPGGVLVAETINTNCPLALSNFYLDPTHVRPVPPRLLAFMVGQSGFSIDSLYFSAPTAADAAPTLRATGRDLPEESRVYQDYAVIATRRGAPTAGLPREANAHHQPHLSA